MAIIDVNLGSSDQTINSANAADGDTVRVTALGDQSLTVDGVDVNLTSFAGVQAGSNASFNVVNDGGLTVGSNLLGLSALNSVNFNLADTSNLTLDLGAVNAGQLLGLDGVLGKTAVNFSGAPVSDGAGGFTGSTFAIDPPTVGLGFLGSFNADVTGFGLHDQISLGDGATFGGFSLTSQTSGDLVINVPGLAGSTPYTFNLSGLSQDFAADLATNGASFFDPETGTFEPVCFLKGTLIATPDGERPVEDLREGDAVVTQSGVGRVKWVGRRAYRRVQLRSAEERASHMPIRIRANAVADGLPSRDVLVSPGHHVHVFNALVPARALVNGVTIVQEAGLPLIEYYHLELESFAMVSSGGLFSESWADGGNRDFFHNVDVTTLGAEERVRRRAERPGYILARQGRVIERFRLALAQRAAALGTDAASADARAA